jgi:hypothetical protein
MEDASNEILFKCYDLQEVTEEDVDSLLQFVDNPENNNQVELVIGDKKIGPSVIFLLAGLRYQNNNRLKRLPKCIDGSKVCMIFSSWIPESKKTFTLRQNQRTNGEFSIVPGLCIVWNIPGTV